MTLCDSIDCSLPGTSIHGIFQATVLEWVAISLAIRDGGSAQRCSGLCLGLGLFWALSGSGSGSPSLSNAPVAESCLISPGGGAGLLFSAPCLPSLIPWTGNSKPQPPAPTPPGPFLLAPMLDMKADAWAERDISART